MNKNAHIDIEQVIKEEEKWAEKQRRRESRERNSHHQLVKNNVGQFVDAHFDMEMFSLAEAEIGRGQVETLLRLQTDSDTLRTIENVETENEVLGRIRGLQKKKSRIVYESKQKKV